MGFFSFLKYTFIIFTAHLAISCGAAFENLRVRETTRHQIPHKSNGWIKLYS
jgi:hypothetical protein